MFTWLPSHQGSLTVRCFQLVCVGTVCCFPPSWDFTWISICMFSFSCIFCLGISVSHHQITSRCFCLTFILFCLIPPFLSLKVQYISYPFSLKGRERRGLHVSVYFVFHFLALVFWVHISCLAVSLALYSFTYTLSQPFSVKQCIIWKLHTVNYY